MKEMRIMRAIGDIDDNYIDEAAPLTDRKAIRFGSWAGYAGIAAAAVLVIGIGVFAMTRNNSIPVTDPPQTTTVTEPDVTVTEQTSSEPEQTTETDMPMVMMGNPFEYFDTLEEASKAAGFDMTAPESFGKYTERTISTIGGDLMEVTYSDTDGNIGLYIRKQKSSEDISGDYNAYGFTKTVVINGKSVTISGNGEAVFKAIWFEGESAYSVTAAYDEFSQDPNANKGLTQTELEEIIKNVK